MRLERSVTSAFLFLIDFKEATEARLKLPLKKFSKVSTVSINSHQSFPFSSHPTRKKRKMWENIGKNTKQKY